MKLKPLASLLALALCAANSASANSNVDFNSNLRFNFSNPGAPNLAIAGAFTAKADDASAAVVNPAGLTQVDNSMIAEYRRFEYDTRFVVGGQATYQFAGNRATISNDRPEFGEISSSANALSYLAATGSWNGFHFAGFYNTLADFSADFRFNGATLNDADPQFQPFDIFPVDIAGRFEVDAFGVAVARRVGNISLGVSLQHQRLDLFSRSIEVPLRPVQSIITQSGDDSDLTWSAGILWRNEENRWGLGANWRSGADFRVDVDSRFRVQAGGPDENITPLDYTLRIPHQFALGGYWKPSVDSGLTLTADAVWIDYSRLSAVADVFQVPSVPGTRLPEAEDGWEYRFGLEYRLADRPLFLRAGVWREPDSSLVFDGPQVAGLNTAGNLINGEIYDRFLFRKRGDEWHGSLGFGYVFDRFSIDAAADFSKPADTYSLSVTYLFGE